MRIAAKLRSQRTLPVGKSNQDPKKFDLQQPKCLNGGEDYDIILDRKLFSAKYQNGDVIVKGMLIYEKRNV